MTSEPTDLPYGEVTADDLSTDDLIQDGADAAALTPDAADEGAVAVDQALHTDDALRVAGGGSETESIDERLAQEQADPAAEVAYGFDETDSEGGVPDEADATASDEV